MKEKIRKKILSLRDQKTETELAERTERIKRNLLKTKEFKNAKTILFYVSTKNEVKTESMIKEALKLGKRIAVPVADIRKNSLKLFGIKDYDRELALGAFGIPEPKRESRREVPLEAIDLVMVPGIAFDRKGVRIGYGKGFYDRLLSSVKKTRTLGLAYDFQIVNEIPPELHDIRVDGVVTETGVIKT